MRFNKKFKTLRKLTNRGSTKLHQVEHVQAFISQNMYISIFDLSVHIYSKNIVESESVIYFEQAIVKWKVSGLRMWEKTLKWRFFKIYQTWNFFNPPHTFIRYHRVITRRLDYENIILRPLWKYSLETLISRQNSKFA